MDGEEYIGTAKEIAEVSGYYVKTIGNIARGDMRPRAGIEIEGLGPSRLGSSVCAIAAEWDKVISMFKKVEWVRKGTTNARKLEVTK
jgi:hypothetical protein